MDRLIDIESFRKQNHITQTDIAEYLGISRSFVNQVENGKAALPESRLNELLEKSPKEKGWDIYPLVPAYGRILKLYNILKNDDTTGMNRLFLGLETNPFELEDDVIENIRLGRTGIAESVIQRIHEHFPYINRYWLETGEGNPYSFLQSKEMGNELAKEVFNLRLEIDRQSQAIRRMEDSLREILKSLPKSS
ncbi:MAG: helix-turn-helix transcriptional regulator [Bacteroidales bacterium]|nr:helix-turn-helix transcriptional regulator [Bacteroidales bacterium]